MKATRLVNITGKRLNVVLSDKSDYAVIDTDNSYPRPYVTLTYKTIGEVEGVEICRLKKGEVMNLPEQEPDTLFIVNRMVAEVAQRSDLVVPDKMIKTNDGGVLACRCFSTV